MKLFFDDGDFDAQLQRTAAKAAWRACDLGEVFALAGRITPGDYDSWYQEWFNQGESNQELAEAEAAKGHDQNAADAFLRASEYYRSAYFYSRREPQGAPLLEAFRRCRDTFRQAAPLLPHRVEQVEIPYEDIHLEGYVLLTDEAAGAPTVLLPSGYDSPVEESYTLGAVEALLRGCNVVMFSGPGQAEMLYERQIPFRHDFEAVIGPVIDFVGRHAALDDDRIALIGRSFGGYLAPRAASAEHRLGAMSADPAQTDMVGPLKARLPAEMLAMIDNGDPAFNDAIWKSAPGVAGQEFWMSRIRAHGLSTPLEYAQELDKWVVDVEAIECPTFVSYGEGDFAQLSAKEFYDRLTVPKQFTMYREAEGGGGHCEGMGPSRYFNDLFGWLHDAIPSQIA
jgi:pimeloyl-ACP methyl ester carboxylesterase